MDFNSEKFDDILIITAARPKPWVREKFSPSYWARMFGESLVYDYKDKMDQLRRIDDQIYDWTKEIAGILKEIMNVRKAVGKNDPTRFVDIAILLGQLNKKFIQIKEVAGHLEDISEEARKELEQKYQLELPENSEHIYSLTPAEREELFQYKKEASVKDFLGKSLFYERLSRKQDKKRKDAVLKIVDQAADTVAFVRAKLKDLGSARSAGRIGEYIDILRDIGKRQELFQTKFLKVYNDFLKEPVEIALQKTKDEKVQVEKERQELAQPDKDKLKDYLAEKDELEKAKQDWQAEQKAIKEAPPKTVLQEPAFTEPEKTPSFQLDVSEQPKPKSVYEVHTNDLIPSEPAKTNKEPKTQQSVNIENVDLEGKPNSPILEELDKEEKEAPIQFSGKGLIPVKIQNRKFLTELKKLAEQDNPYLIAKAILEYSEQLEDKDQETSLRLLSIVEGLIEG